MALYPTVLPPPQSPGVYQPGSGNPTLPSPISGQGEPDNLIQDMYLLVSRKE